MEHGDRRTERRHEQSALERSTEKWRTSFGKGFIERVERNRGIFPVKEVWKVDFRSSMCRGTKPWEVQECPGNREKCYMCVYDGMRMERWVGARWHLPNARPEMCSFRQSGICKWFYAKRCHSQVCSLEMPFTASSLGEGSTGDKLLVQVSGDEDLI